MTNFNNGFADELIKINQKIVSGVHYKQVLDFIFDSLQYHIPCDRISIDTYNAEHVLKIKELTDSLALVVEQGRLQKFYDENQYKNKMYSMFTHDLRSPIGVMSGFLDLISGEEWYSHLEEKDKEIFAMLRRNCNSMLQLVNDLNDSDSFRKKDFNFNFVDTPLDTFFKDIEQNAKILGGIKHINIKSNISVGDFIAKNIDPLRIRQAIDNFISNAIKFSKPHTNVEVNATIVNNILRVSVIDQGPGIPVKEIGKLFKEHSTTSVRPTAGETSTGLGLSIVKKIIEQHGGVVSVKTEQGVGSTFEFTIPLKIS